MKLSVKNISSDERKRYAIAIVLLVIIGAFLRIYKITNLSLWIDEITSAQTMEHSLRWIWLKKYAHPLGYTHIYFFTHIFGINDFTLRFPSAIFGAAAIPLFYVTGKHLFNRKTAALATPLFVLSPFHIDHSQQARFYAFFAFFSILTVYFLIRAMDEKKIWLWVCFFLTTLINVLTHEFGIFVLGSEVLYALIITASKIRQISLKKCNVKKLALACGVILLIAVGCLLLYINFPYAKKFVMFWKRPHDARIGKDFISSVSFKSFTSIRE